MDIVAFIVPLVIIFFIAYIFAFFQCKGKGIAGANAKITFKRVFANFGVVVIFMLLLGVFLSHTNSEVQEQPSAEKVEKKKDEQPKQPKEPIKPTRKELIEKQFSAWDGSHRLLVKMVEKGMHDPDSFEHVDTFYNDMGDKIRVTMKFRGKNKLGAKVLNTVKAEFDIDGNFLREVK